jgi:hypothetical protein
MRLGPVQRQLFQQLYIFGVCYSVNYAPAFVFLTKRVEMADPTRFRMKPALKLGGFLGFTAGFLLAYQRSSRARILQLYHTPYLYILSTVRFWGWAENKREEEKDLAELSQRARDGKALYGESPQPEWVQAAAARNSQWSQLKFCTSCAITRILYCSLHGRFSYFPNVRQFYSLSISSTSS